jgi:hypothetical protein
MANDALPRTEGQSKLHERDFQMIGEKSPFHSLSDTACHHPRRWHKHIKNFYRPIDTLETSNFPNLQPHGYGTNSWLLCVTTFYYLLAIALVHVPT